MSPVLVDGGGGGAVNLPGDLVLVDTSKLSYLRGTWEGYLQALVTMRHNCALAVPTPAQWQGDRADRFRRWCNEAGADLDKVQAAIQAVISSLEQFATYAIEINTQMAWAAQAVKENTTGYAVGGNTITGTFTYQGYPTTITVMGATIRADVQYSDQPAWLAMVRTYLLGAERDFQTYSSLADSTLGAALSGFRQLAQFGHLGRSSASSGPLGDPTWQALTGGGLIRPASTAGFHTNPFSTALMPDWYDPTTAQKISNYIGEHEWVVDVFAIASAFVGQPEVGAAVEVLVHGTKLGIDATDGDLKEVPWDAIDLALDGAGAGDVADDIVKQLIYIPKHALAEPVSPEVAKAITNFVQARMREAVAEAVTGPDGKAQVNLTTISDISAEAAARLQTLEAAGATS